MQMTRRKWMMGAIGFFIMGIAMCTPRLFAQIKNPNTPPPDALMEGAVQAMMSAIELERQIMASAVDQSVEAAFTTARAQNAVMDFFNTDQWELWWEMHGVGLSQLLRQANIVVSRIVYMTTFGRSDDGVGAVTLERLKIETPAYLFGVQYDDGTMALALCDDARCVFRDVIAGERQPAVQHNGMIDQVNALIARGVLTDRL